MAMSEQARRSQREYHRKWREANKEKVKANNERYWERKAQREQAAK